MKRVWLLAVFLAFLLPARAQQVPVTANLTAQDSGACTTANACVVMNVPKDNASAVIQLSGTWTATVQFEASTGTGSSGTPFTSIGATPIGGSTAVTSATANGAWRLNVASVYVLRVRVSSYSGGTIAAALTSSAASSFSGGQGGGGGGGGVGGISGSGTPGNFAEFTAAQVIGNAPTIDSGGITQNSQPVSQPASLYSCVNSTSGTTNQLLVTRDASGNCINLPAAQTTKIVGVVYTGGGTLGSSLICKIGSCPVLLDNTSTIDDCIVAAASGSEGHDAGATCPTGVQQIGIAQNVNGGAGTAAQVDVFISDILSVPVQVVQINGTLLAGVFPNLNNTTPAAQTNFLNCFFQTDNNSPISNVSLECPQATGAQNGFIRLAGDLSGGTATAPTVTGIQTIPVTFSGIAANDVICFPTTSTLINCHPGVPIRTFSTGSDTMLAADRTGWVLPTTAGTVAETLPQAGSAGFTSNYVFGTLNNATGIDTITPTTSTINGASTATIPPNWFALTTSDNTNYFAAIMPTLGAFPNCPDVTGNHLNSTVTGITCGTSGGGGGGGGTLTSVAASSPITATPNPIVATGTLACPTCNTSAASLTLGEPAIGGGGQALVTEPGVLNCATFSGADDSLKIQACLVALRTLNTQAGIADATGLTGLTWSVNPFAAASSPNSGVLLLPPGDTLVDVPVVLKPDWSIKGFTQRSVTGSIGSTLKASTNFRATYSTGTITIGTNGASDVITGSGTTWTTANLSVGCAFVGGTLPNNTFGIVGTIGSTTSITLPWGASNGTGAAAASSYVIYCPILLHGSGGSSNFGAQFGMFASNLGLDCNNVAGCVGEMNWYGQQYTGARFIQIRGVTNVGLDIEFQAQNSGPWDQFIVTPGSSGTSSTLPIVVRSGAQIMRPLSNLSVSKGLATSVSVGVDIQTNNLVVTNADVEQLATGISIGANISCVVGCPMPPRITNGVHISGAGNQSSSGTTLVHISNAFGSPDSTMIENLAQTGITNILVDDANSCTVTFTREGLYLTSHTGTVLVDSSGTCSPAGGSVTSVAQTVPSWLSVAGSPITSNGTLAITAASGQTSHQVIGTCGSATSFAPCTLAASDLPSSVKARGLVFSYGDPSGSAISASSTATDYMTVPFACTISAYNLLVDSGTVTVKFWKIATGTAIPTVTNSINTSGVAISSGTAIHSTTLSDFTTTTVTANDIMAMNVTAATAKFVSGTLECDQ